MYTQTYMYTIHIGCCVAYTELPDACQTVICNNRNDLLSPYVHKIKAHFFSHHKFKKN